MKDKKIPGIKKDINIIIHFLKLTHRVNKMYIPTLFLSAIFKAMTPFINIIMPKFIIDELINEQRVDVFITLVVITIVGNFIINLINRWFATIIEIKNMEIIYGFDLIIGEKIMELDFEKIEDPEVLNLKEQAIFPIKNQGVIWQMIRNLANLISQTITIIALVGIIATLDLLLIAFVVIIVLFNSAIFKKSQAMQYEFHQDLVPVNRKFAYYAEASTDFSIAKDVRLYDMTPLLMKKIRNFSKETSSTFGKLFTMVGKYEAITQVNIQLQMLGIYGYIAFKVFRGAISIGDFIMYTNAAINFSTSVSQIFSTYVELIQMCRYLDLFLELESIEDTQRKGNKKTSDLEDYKLEFRNVSFKYPRAKDYTLKNVNITINYGEKLSVVGLNGAGKTTFIKLLSRLYSPTEGEILLNGVNINEYKYEEYMKLLSVVFQDYKLLSFSIKENIALSDHEVAADGNIEEVIEKSGFSNDLEKLEQGIYTSVYKNFDKKGIEFSGGQSQKLAMARAIYKNAPIVILDEPTAALDPFAEFEIYSRFNELIGGKTTIYISHRLSSCKFCDKIAVFDKGEIVQYGTHEELVREENKEYHTMYSAQSQYYV